MSSDRKESINKALEERNFTNSDDNGNKNYVDKSLQIKSNHYIAPKYDPKKIQDKKLIKRISVLKPEIIIINIGGGIQEILGFYLKNNLKYKPMIICTGAAIAYLTTDQAPINDFIDKIYLGW